MLDTTIMSDIINYGSSFMWFHFCPYITLNQIKHIKRRIDKQTPTSHILIPLKPKKLPLNQGRKIIFLCCFNVKTNHVAVLTSKMQPYIGTEQPVITRNYVQEKHKLCRQLEVSRGTGNLIHFRNGMNRLFNSLPSNNAKRRHGCMVNVFIWKSPCRCEW